MKYPLIRTVMFVVLFTSAVVPALLAAPMADQTAHRPAANYNGVMRLVGTAVVENSPYRIAVIESEADGRQRSYRQGDRANGFRIKKILGDRIVVQTSEGEAVIFMTGSMLPKIESLAGAGVVDASAVAHGPRPPETRRHDTRYLNRGTVASALADIDAIVQAVNIETVTVYGKPAGVRIAPVESGSIYSIIGLKSGDVIQQINDATVSLPEQAFAIFRQLKEGKDVDIKVKGRRTRWIHLTVN